MEPAARKRAYIAVVLTLITSFAAWKDFDNGWKDYVAGREQARAEYEAKITADLERLEGKVRNDFEKRFRESDIYKVEAKEYWLGLWKLMGWMMAVPLLALAGVVSSPAKYLSITFLGLCGFYMLVYIMYAATGPQGPDAESHHQGFLPFFLFFIMFVAIVAATACNIIARLLRMAFKRRPA